MWENNLQPNGYVICKHEGQHKVKAITILSVKKLWKRRGTMSYYSENSEIKHCNCYREKYVHLDFSCAWRVKLGIAEEDWSGFAAQISKSLIEPSSTMT